MTVAYSNKQQITISFFPVLDDDNSRFILYASISRCGGLNRFLRSACLHDHDIQMAIKKAKWWVPAATAVKLNKIIGSAGFPFRGSLGCTISAREILQLFIPSPKIFSTNTEEVSRYCILGYVQ